MRTFARAIAVSLIAVIGVGVMPAQSASALNVPCCRR